MEKRSKRWTYEETKAFLSFYAGRKQEFVQARKRRLGYANVKEDMISAGFDSDITVHQLEIKMQTLLRAYKTAKDNASRTGASPCTPPFYEEMEEIFGDKPIHSRSESYNVGIEFLLSDSDVSLPTSPDTPSASNTFIFPEVGVGVASTSEAFEIGDASASLYPIPNASHVVAASTTSGEAAISVAIKCPIGPFGPLFYFLALCPGQVEMAPKSKF